MRFAMVLVLCVACATTACHSTMPSPDVMIHVDSAHPGAAIAADFAGASYETSTLIGASYFKPDNERLLQTFATLGIHHLRLGGNEADRGPLPVASDIDTGLAFADVAAVPVIYTLRLKDYDPNLAATTARTILDLHPGRIACFSIGNEPNAYTTGYTQYRDEFGAYVAAIGDSRAVYCGADVFGGDVDWITAFARDRGAALLENTVHEYYGGDGTTCDAAAARDRLLSPALDGEYAANHDAFAPATLSPATGFRISETNSYFNGGCIGASDTFAATLWGLDYLYWWASHDARGLDFHTGDHVSGTTTTYSLFVTSPTGYHVRPLGYAMKAFDLGAHGRLAPLSIVGSDELTAYAVVSDDGTTTVTIIDKAHGIDDHSRALALSGLNATDARGWRLAAPGIDAADGITLGGAAIDDQGEWSATAESLSVEQGDVRFTIDPASAVVINVR